MSPNPVVGAMSSSVDVGDSCDNLQDNRISEKKINAKDEAHGIPLADRFKRASMCEGTQKTQGPTSQNHKMREAENFACFKNRYEASLDCSNRELKLEIPKSRRWAYAGATLGAAGGLLDKKIGILSASRKLLEEVAENVKENDSLSDVCSVMDAIDGLVHENLIQHAQVNDILLEARKMCELRISEIIGEAFEGSKEFDLEFVTDIQDVLTNKDAMRSSDFGQRAADIQLRLVRFEVLNKILDGFRKKWSEKFIPSGKKMRIARKEELDCLFHGGIEHRKVEELAKCIAKACCSGLSTASGAVALAAASSGTSLLTVALRLSGLLSAGMGIASAVVEEATTGCKNEVKKYQSIHKYLIVSSKIFLDRMPCEVLKIIQRIDKEWIPEFIEKKDFEQVRNLLKRRQLIYLSFPTEVIDLVGEKSAQEKMDRDVEELLSAYPADTRKPLASMVEEIRCNSQQRQGHRVQVYLKGDPGVGKTRFVEKLASILNVPVYSAMLSDRKTLDRLRGPGDRLVDPFWNDKVEDIDVAGLLPFALLESGCKNPIIFLDEAGPILSGEFDRCTEWQAAGARQAVVEQLAPEKKLLTLGGVGDISLDFSHATIFFAGNHKMRNDGGGLVSRIRSVDFPWLTLETREIIAKSFIRESVLNYVKLSVSEQEALAKKGESYVSLVTDAESSCRIGGARLLKSALNQVMSKLFRAKLRGKSVDEEDIVESINEFYRNYAEPS